MADPMTTPTNDEINAKLDASEARVDARLANFDVSVKTGVAELRTAFAELRADMARQIGELRAEMEKMRADMHKDMKNIVKWIIGFGLANIGAIFAVSRMAEKPTSQAYVRPPPIIIITIPQPAAPPVAPAPAK
ncbi:hypothetical protein [Massilia scottii]|uniref:hypothetical protein n=1 Tax=Massilia scottii TaxID=3057166 RepID=UPI0027966760|nr:hypothetical protein [Massilia sp. CCM 9029]MDQ1832879.1 hypothetical protein [Massilia sp. CCM 9029]